MGTEESEDVDSGYASRFRRPPTVGQFRITSGLCKSMTHKNYIYNIKLDRPTIPH